MKKKQQVFNGILLWVGLAFLGLTLQKFYNILQYIFFLRVPIIVGLLLLLLPTISVSTGLSAMLKNLFILRANNQLVLVIGGAVLAGLATTEVFDIILYNSHLRFDVPEHQGIPEFLQYVIAIILSLPIAIKATQLSKKEIKEGEHAWEGWGIIFGVVAGAFLIITTHLAKIFFKSNQILEQALLKIISFLPVKIQRGYVDGSGNLSYGIAEIVVFSIFLLILYGLGYLIFKPRPIKNRFEVPALFYITLILSIMVVWIGGISFFNDVSRVPTLLLFLVISSASYTIFKVDHFYKMFLNKNWLKPTEKKWINVISQRLNNQQSEDKTLVVVCASGGGIQASGWTTKVLTGLQEELGSEFTKAIGWISSVSGGSVGTMFYLDRFGEQGYPEEGELKKIFKSATEDSLDATGWGLAYPDLLRFIGFPFVVPKAQEDNTATEQDRGTAIEIDWKGEMKNPNATLASWSDKIDQGIIPIPIFNATLVEDGRRFLVSPMTFSKHEDCKSIDFNTLYPEYDIDVTTAARLSATFPYVSPVCRPSQETKWNYHIGDGGYFDNFGIGTSVDLLDNLLESEQCNQIKRVILIQINAFPDDENLQEEKGAPGWQMEVIGSLLALLNVRSSTQNEGNALNIKLLTDKYKCGYKDDEQEKLQQFLKDKSCQKGVEIMHIPIKFPRGKINPPLSWQLTQEQKKAIQNAWEEWKITNSTVILKLKKIFPE
ncbi:patatin-like phospholipase family protein [Nostoc edaphicum CCNP1411]|uniref:Patatin-like phospholipase family protein n=1 Tax=Nostoc edaphicum CCNP1411 TaxID=1472755 RepID=A0A7D7QRA4_9NOSO|nr:patatin-like phospholipase family protein [Nostoc edaphicum]QMS91945.1 patatin-like phospholipase family protein [Nostoc edaphicum CCNP1411]